MLIWLLLHDFSLIIIQLQVCFAITCDLFSAKENKDIVFLLFFIHTLYYYCLSLLYAIKELEINNRSIR